MLSLLPPRVTVRSNIRGLGLQGRNLALRRAEVTRHRHQLLLSRAEARLQLSDACRLFP